MHEFVLSARNLKRENGITALDVAKRLMDFGFHPPTVYFPLVVPEALMIEPPEETRTFARMCLSLIEEAEAIDWYEQRLAVERDPEARAIMANAQQEEF